MRVIVKSNRLQNGFTLWRPSTRYLVLESRGNACYSEIKASPTGLPFGDQVRDILCWSLWEMRVIVKSKRLQRVKNDTVH